MGRWPGGFLEIIRDSPRFFHFRIILESDGVKIEEIPLSPKEWIENEIENDVKKLEKDIVDINLFFDAFTNPFRVKMLGRLMENEEFTLSFSDFLSELDMNPKSVREHAVKLIDAGLLGADLKANERP